MVSLFHLSTLYPTDQLQNKHICVLALYDYDCENITISQLAIRQQSKTDDAELINYLQNEQGWGICTITFIDSSRVSLSNPVQ